MKIFWGAVLAAITLTALPNSLAGQGTPIAGTASVTASANVPSLVLGSPVQVRLSISLASVTGKAPGGASTPAVLGGYQVTLAFDNTRLQLQSVAGGTSSEFAATPTFTNLGLANSSGSFALTAAQTSPSSPTGVVSIAVLSFTTLALGSASIQTTPISLSSAFQPGPPSVGPAAIPGTGSSISVSIVATTAPAAPANISPLDGAISAPSPVSLAWSAAAGAASYGVYLGTTNDPPLVATTAATSQTVSTLPLTRYFWRIAASNAVGSTSGPTWSFTTAAAMTSDFSMSPPGNPVAGQPVLFSDLSSGGPTAWSWDFGDGATSAEKRPFHTYAAPGSYTATLTASAGSTAFEPRTRSVIVSANNALRLNAAHAFEVTILAEDPATSRTDTGLAIPQNDIFGYFSFPAITANPDNPEVFVKLLDATPIGSNYWVFYGGLTSLQYTLTVRDLSTGDIKTYSKPAFPDSLSACGGFDTSGFPPP